MGERRKACTTRGGPAPVRAYITGLLPDILEGKIRPGDVVWCPPGKKHWHGATAATAMSHIAIVEKLDGKGVDWLEKVSDEQYLSE